MIKVREWTEAGVRFIDQTKLPTEEVYVTCSNYEQVADAIRTMIVRGAPAIGVAAAMGVALGVQNSSARDHAALRQELEEISKVIAATRPTAANLFWAIERMRRKFDALQNLSIPEIKRALVAEAQRMYVEEITDNPAMSRPSATLMPASRSVINHF